MSLGDHLRGRLCRLPDFEIVRVQDAVLAETPDSIILAWASADGLAVIELFVLPHCLTAAECKDLVTDFPL